VSRIRTINDIGIGFKGIGHEHIADIRVYPESGSVQIWIETNGREAMQYLDPIEAMEFAEAFKRCAIEALKERARMAR
jgi:hypothetical protein